MSYTEYMNRKKAAAPVVLDTRPKMDASTYTRHKRVVAAVGAYAPTNGVINNPMDMNDSATLTSKRPQETIKASGGSVPDASVFTDYAAGIAASRDYKNGPPLGRVVLNGSLAGMTSISSCANSGVADPTFPASTNTKTVNGRTVSLFQANMRGSDWVNATGKCATTGRAEPHNNGDNNTGKTRFIDDTISLNTGSLRIGTGSFGSTGSTVQSSNGTVTGCPPANHTHEATVPRAGWSARPTKGAGGLFVSTVPRPGDARKVGGLVPSDHTKYVEKHHGNDLNVNPRRVPTEYQIPAGAPAHLKINDPKPTV